MQRTREEVQEQDCIAIFEGNYWRIELLSSVSTESHLLVRSALSSSVLLCPVLHVCFIHSAPVRV